MDRKVITKREWLESNSDNTWDNAYILYNIIYHSELQT